MLGGAIVMWLLACRWVVPMGESAIGVNWGTVSFLKLQPSTVVDLLKDNKIPKVKVFEAEPEVLKALMGSGIQVMVGIPNQMLALLGTSPTAADLWLRQNVSAYIGKDGADIRFFFSFQNHTLFLLHQALHQPLLRDKFLLSVCRDYQEVCFVFSNKVFLVYMNNLFKNQTLSFKINSYLFP